VLSTTFGTFLLSTSNILTATRLYYLHLVVLQSTVIRTFVRHGSTVIVFRPRRTYSVSGLFLQVEFRRRSVGRSVCPSVGSDLLGKTADSIDIPFGGPGCTRWGHDGCVVVRHVPEIVPYRATPCRDATHRIRSERTFRLSEKLRSGSEGERLSSIPSLQLVA